MSNEIAVVEKQLHALEPQFAQVMANTGVAPERLVRTVLVCVEQTPKLLQCNRQSLFNSAMSAAVLGLECDGVTGQAYLIPFKDKAQLVIGYKGMNTLAARSGYTINGAVVREGDAFDFMEGTGGFVKHKRKLGGESKRPIIAAWATATAPGREPIVSIMSIDELMATKNRAPGSRKKDSPWNDPAVGFQAMCIKTAIRKLARFMPLNVMQYAAAMEDQLELGRPSHIEPEKGVVIDGDAHTDEPRTLNPDDLSAPFVVYGADGTPWKRFAMASEWDEFMHALIDKMADQPEKLAAMVEANRETIKRVTKEHPETARIIDHLGLEGIEI